MPASLKELFQKDSRLGNKKGGVVHSTPLGPALRIPNALSSQQRRKSKLSGPKRDGGRESWRGTEERFGPWSVLP